MPSFMILPLMVAKILLKLLNLRFILSNSKNKYSQKYLNKLRWFYGLVLVIRFTGVFTDGLSIPIRRYEKNVKTGSQEYLMVLKCHKAAK